MTWRHIVDTKWCKIAKYGISVQILSLQGWCAARTTHFDDSYDVTIATYSLPGLYLPKIKKMPYLLLESLTDFLVLVLCNIHISSHPLNKQQEQIRLLEGENSDFIFWTEWAWSPLGCRGNITVEISWNFLMSATTVQSFSSIQKSLHFLWLYIILCLQCDVTSHLE